MAAGDPEWHVDQVRSAAGDPGHRHPDGSQVDLIGPDGPVTAPIKALEAMSSQLDGFGPDIGPNPGTPPWTVSGLSGTGAASANPTAVVL